MKKETVEEAGDDSEESFLRRLQYELSKYEA